ncbi:MAG: hypothetical protein FJY85_10075, partial [Deltaproteobacteria bacterium]|nr:hypothetical protein [Deltaproteobacteria bacterium]
MKKALVVGLLALLSLGVFAQTNPYTTATVDLWKVVQDCRTFFKNTLVTTGITRENLVHLNVFLTSRQM